MFDDDVRYRALSARDPRFDGHFFVAPGFQVSVSTQLKPDEFVGKLRTTMPMGRFQPIQPSSTAKTS